MITKGIITSIDFTGNTCTVRMPFFETANNDPITGTATVSNTPGSYNGYKVGDVVWVAFENGQMDTPVILGKLYLGVEAEKGDPRGVLNVENSTITGTATMPADTKLKISTDSQVPNTLNPYSSISSIANGLNTLNTQVNELDKDLGHKISSVLDKVDSQGNEFNSLVEQTATNITNEVSATYLPVNSSGPTPDSQGIKRGLGWELTNSEWNVIAHDTVDTNNDGIEDVEKSFKIVTIDRKGMTINGNLRLNGYPTDTVIEYASFPKKDLDNQIIDTQEDAEAYERIADPAIVWATEMPDYDANKYIWQRVITKSYVWHDPDSGHPQGYWSNAPETTSKVYTCLSNIDDAAETIATAVATTQVEAATTTITTNFNVQVNRLDQVALKLQEGKSSSYYGTLSAEQKKEVQYGDSLFATEGVKVGTMKKKLASTNFTDTAEFKEQALKGGYVTVDGQKLKMLELTPEQKAQINTAANQDPNFELEVYSKDSLLQCIGKDENDDPIWTDVNGEMITNKLTTNYVNALNVTAKKLTVLTDTSGGSYPRTIFEADGDNHSVQVGGFNVGWDSIYKPVTIDDQQYKLAKSNTILLTSMGGWYHGSIAGSEDIYGWNFTIGENFGVRTCGNNESESGKSELWVNRGHIGKFELGDNSSGGSGYGGAYLKSGIIGQANSVCISPDYFKQIANLHSNSQHWAFIAGDKFGVTTDGALYSTSGKISQFEISADGLSYNKNNPSNCFKLQQEYTTNVDDLALTYLSPLVNVSNSQDFGFYLRLDVSKDADILKLYFLNTYPESTNYYIALSGPFSAEEATNPTPLPYLTTVLASRGSNESRPNEQVLSNYTAYTLENVKAGTHYWITTSNVTVVNGQSGKFYIYYPADYLSTSDSNYWATHNLNDIDGAHTLNKVSHGLIMSFGQNFAVTDEGYLSATNVNLSGNIAATTGNIGPLTVTENNLTYTPTGQSTPSFRIAPAASFNISAGSLPTNSTTALYATSGAFGALNLGNFSYYDTTINQQVSAGSVLLTKNTSLISGKETFDPGLVSYQYVSNAVPSSWSWGAKTGITSYIKTADLPSIPIIKALPTQNYGSKTYMDPDSYYDTDEEEYDSYCYRLMFGHITNSGTTARWTPYSVDGTLREIFSMQATILCRADSWVSGYDAAGYGPQWTPDAEAGPIACTWNKTNFKNSHLVWVYLPANTTAEVLIIGA